MMKSFAMLALLSLAAAVPAHAEDAKGKVTDKSSPDYVRCKKEPIIGSLVQKTKICRTNAEWRKFSSSESEESRRLVEQNQGRPPGGP